MRPSRRLILLALVPALVALAKSEIVFSLTLVEGNAALPHNRRTAPSLPA